MKLERHDQAALGVIWLSASGITLPSISGGLRHPVSAIARHRVRAPDPRAAVPYLGRAARILQILD